MRIVCVLSFVALLAACDAPTSAPTAVATSMTLEVHWSSSAEIAKAAYSYHDVSMDRDGYAVLKKTGDAYACDIYLAHPSKIGEAEQMLVGHELMHCIFGSYHPEP